MIRILWSAILGFINFFIVYVIFKLEVNDVRTWIFSGLFFIIFWICPYFYVQFKNMGNCNDCEFNKYCLNQVEFFKISGDKYDAPVKYCSRFKKKK